MRTAWDRAQGRPRPNALVPNVARPVHGLTRAPGSRPGSPESRSTFRRSRCLSSCTSTMRTRSSSRSAARTGSGSSIVGSRGRGAAGAPAILELARKVAKNRPGIAAILVHGVSNARVETVNTQAGCSPGSPLGSTQPRRSSCPPCSASAAPCPPMPDR